MAHCTPHRVGEASATELGTQNAPGKAPVRAQRRIIKSIYIYIIQILSVCLSSIGGQTAGPIMTKFGTHMRIDLGMVPTKYWPHEWPGSVGSLGPISESGLSCQLLL